MDVGPSPRQVRSGATHWLVPGRGARPIATGERFILMHFWLPLGAFAALSWLLMLAGGDLFVADWLYALQGHRWALQSAFVTQSLLHLGGRDASAMAWLCVFAAWCVACARGSLHAWRRPLGYVLLATLASTAAVAWIKTWSNMDCPWDLLRYGGARGYYGLLSVRPIGLARGTCFPAGHASAGYAWMALYFGLLAVRPRWRWIGLGMGLVAGAAFGIAQQLRGAHFASHDTWTAIVCWMTALGLYQLPWSTPHAVAQVRARLAWAVGE